MKAISDMRLAIRNTNVVLSLAISPGLILITSDMIILKKKVVGYNNTLTLATKEMKFGVNEEVNKVSTPPHRRGQARPRKGVQNGPPEKLPQRHKGSPFQGPLR